MSRIFRFTVWLLGDDERLMNMIAMCRLAGTREAALPHFRLFLTQYAYQMKLYGVTNTTTEIMYIIDAVWDLEP